MRWKVSRGTPMSKSGYNYATCMSARVLLSGGKRRGYCLPGWQIWRHKQLEQPNRVYPLSTWQLVHARLNSPGAMCTRKLH